MPAGRRAGHAGDQGVARYVEKYSPNTITAVLVGVAGVTFLLTAGGGLYWLIPAAVTRPIGQNVLVAETPGIIGSRG